MSVKKAPLNDKKAIKANDHASASKRVRFDRCFSFAEISIEPGKSLKDLDSNKFKSEIKRWAKAVVAYARQVGLEALDEVGESRALVIHLCHH